MSDDNEETRGLSEEQFQRHQDGCFRLVDKLVRELVGRGVHPFAIANALNSHGATLLATVDGREAAAELLEGSAAALRELQDAADVPGGRKH